LFCEYYQTVTRCLLAGIFAAILLVPGLAARQAPPGWLGQWTLNVEKSVYNPGPPPYRRGTFTVQPHGDLVRVVYDLVRPRGGVTHMEWTGRFDGQDYPVHGVEAVVTNAYRRVGDRAFDVVVKLDGRVTATSRVTLSADGRTMTTETVGRNAQGNEVTTTTVYEKSTSRD
jgi:hypothetical protein